MSECVSRSLLAACKDNREAYPESGKHSLAENALGRVDHGVVGKTGDHRPSRPRLRRGAQGSERCIAQARHPADHAKT
nr:hypothetical protein [Xanthomonas translucens]